MNFSHRFSHLVTILDSYQIPFLKKLRFKHRGALFEIEQVRKMELFYYKVNLCILNCKSLITGC